MIILMCLSTRLVAKRNAKHQSTGRAALLENSPRILGHSDSFFICLRELPPQFSINTINHSIRLRGMRTLVKINCSFLLDLLQH